MNLFKKLLRNSRTVEPANGSFSHKMKQIIGIHPKNSDIYLTAFTHRSSNRTDKDGNAINYERLEFLGDAMLGAVIASDLYHKAPHGDEGYLTKMRSKIVSREHLNELGKQLHLIDFVDSKVPSHHFGENIHGNIFEALVGAIFLDLGYFECERFIQKKVIEPYVNIERLENKVISYKSLIIEYCQKKKQSFHFDVFEDDTNETQKHFGVKLSIDNKIISKARATSKKKAEEIAAKRAYYALQEIIEKNL